MNLAGAQTSPLPSHVLLSFSLRKFIRLKNPQTTENSTSYAQELAAIVSRERIDLWVDCDTDIPTSLLTQARAAVESKTGVVCFCTSPTHAHTLSKPATFLKFAAENGLPVPESYEIHSRDEIHKILHQSKGKRKYILSETNGATAATPPPSMLLPRRTLSQTYDEVSRIKIVQNSKLRLEQAVEDASHYRSTSIVVRGKVKAFAACTYDCGSGAYTAVRPELAINVAMMQYVAAAAEKLDDYTGHLSIQFSVDERPGSSTVEKRILPTAARPTLDAPILLFGSVEGSISLVRAYVSVFGRRANGFISGDDDVATPIVQPGYDRGVYAFGYDLYRLVLQPMLRLFTFRAGLFSCIAAAFAFLKQVCFWQEGLYDFQDPLPFWYFYQVYVPIRLLFAALRGTTKELTEELGKAML